MKLYQTESGLYIICDGSVATDYLTADELINYLKSSSVCHLEFYQYETLGEEDKKPLTPDDIDKLVEELQERFSDSRLLKTSFIEVDWKERTLTLYSVDPHDVSNDRRFHVFFRYGDNRIVGVTVLDTQECRAYYRYCPMLQSTGSDSSDEEAYEALNFADILSFRKTIEGKIE